jgi:hypothetical protein
MLDLDNEWITSKHTSVQQSKCFPKQLIVHNTMDNIKCVFMLLVQCKVVFTWLARAQFRSYCANISQGVTKCVHNIVFEITKANSQN